MKPEEFIQTLYLGDRCLRSIHISPWESRIEFEIDLISRIRSSTGNWEFYSDEDIHNGKLIISDIRSVMFSPSGPIPNDVIESLTIESLSDGRYEFRLIVEAVQENGSATLVQIIINASKIHLESPDKPGVAITD